MYPLKFYPVYKQMLWGGSKLQTAFDRNIPGPDTGESWDLACHRSGMSIVSNGAFAGKMLQELLETFGCYIYGNNNRKTEFPLLVKLIDANDNLSVQVHPNDANANRDKGENGKTEAWYVLAADEGVELIFGLKPKITRAEFAEMVSNGETESALRRVAVKAGDLISVPAGIVHALTRGVMVAEVQQNSDTTYRIYDYNRTAADGTPRALHVADALRVIDFAEQPGTDFSGRIVKTPYFEMCEVIIDGNYPVTTQDGFIIYIVVSGNGSIGWTEAGQHRFEMVSAGETVLVPACLRETVLSGQMTVLEVKE